MKKIIIVISVGVIFLTFLFRIIPVEHLWLLQGGSDSDSYDDAINIVNNEFSTDVIIYGDSILFRSEFEYREIDALTTNNIIDSDSEYRFLIINDLDGTANMSDSEILRIKNLLENKSNQLSFIYFGTAKIDRMDRLGLLDCNDSYDFTKNDFTDEELGFSLEYEKGELIPTKGFWVTRDQDLYGDDVELLGETVLYRLEAILKANN